MAAPDSTPGAANGLSHPRFARFAWATLAYTVFVILFGAVVRITHSGAGCGQHWPTCQGEVVHFPKTVETAIELSHRLTSGLSGLLVVALAVGGFQVFGRGHSARQALVASLLTMVVEALIGAVLVKFGLVGNDASASRAVVMSAHLVNTCLLTGSLALSAFFATGRTMRHFFPKCPLEWSLFGTLGVALAISVTGAVTALGDTLFPVDTARAIAERLTADSEAASFLERGRVLHPLVAFLGATFIAIVVWETARIRPRREVVTAARLTFALVLAQITAGVTNVALSAPGFMQVIHLTIATALWIALVVFYATAMERTAPAG
jgi:cytochrome c oxidase assembly protein subunit 15/protoheme IX farnesyltransferase